MKNKQSKTKSSAPVSSGALLGCPFCGAPAVPIPPPGAEGWFVTCVNRNCLVLPSTESFKKRKDAICAWNTRRSKCTNMDKTECDDPLLDLIYGKAERDARLMILTS
jgi:hypothetical protein